MSNVANNLLGKSISSLTGGADVSYEDLMKNVKGVGHFNMGEIVFEKNKSGKGSFSRVNNHAGCLSIFNNVVTTAEQNRATNAAVFKALLQKYDNPEADNTNLLDQDFGAVYNNGKLNDAALKNLFAGKTNPYLLEAFKFLVLEKDSAPLSRDELRLLDKLLAYGVKNSDAVKANMKLLGDLKAMKSGAAPIDLRKVTDSTKAEYWISGLHVKNLSPDEFKRLTTETVNKRAARAQSEYSHFKGNDRKDAYARLVLFDDMPELVNTVNENIRYTLAHSPKVDGEKTADRFLTLLTSGIEGGFESGWAAFVKKNKGLEARLAENNMTLADLKKSVYNQLIDYLGECLHRHNPKLTPQIYSSSADNAFRNMYNGIRAKTTGENYLDQLSVKGRLLDRLMMHDYAHDPRFGEDNKGKQGKQVVDANHEPSLNLGGDPVIKEDFEENIGEKRETGENQNPAMEIGEKNQDQDNLPGYQFGEQKFPDVDVFIDDRNTDENLDKEIKSEAGNKSENIINNDNNIININNINNDNNIININNINNINNTDKEIKSETGNKIEAANDGDKSGTGSETPGILLFKEIDDFLLSFTKKNKQPSFEECNKFIQEKTEQYGLKEDETRKLKIKLSFLQVALKIIDNKGLQGLLNHFKLSEDPEVKSMMDQMAAMPDVMQVRDVIWTFDVSEIPEVIRLAKILKAGSDKAQDQMFSGVSMQILMSMLPSALERIRKNKSNGPITSQDLVDALGLGKYLNNANLDDLKGADLMDALYRKVHDDFMGIGKGTEGDFIRHIMVLGANGLKYDSIMLMLQGKKRELMEDDFLDHVRLGRETAREAKPVDEADLDEELEENFKDRRMSGQKFYVNGQNVLEIGGGGVDKEVKAFHGLSMTPSQLARLSNLAITLDPNLPACFGYSPLPSRTRVEVEPVEGDSFVKGDSVRVKVIYVCADRSNSGVDSGKRVVHDYILKPDGSLTSEGIRLVDKSELKFEDEPTEEIKLNDGGKEDGNIVNENVIRGESFDKNKIVLEEIDTSVKPGVKTEKAKEGKATDGSEINANVINEEKTDEEEEIKIGKNEKTVDENPVEDNGRTKKQNEALKQIAKRTNDIAFALELKKRDTEELVSRNIEKNTYKVKSTENGLVEVTFKGKYGKKYKVLINKDGEFLNKETYDKCVAFCPEHPEYFDHVSAKDLKSVLDIQQKFHESSGYIRRLRNQKMKESKEYWPSDDDLHLEINSYDYLRLMLTAMMIEALPKARQYQNEEKGKDSDTISFENWCKALKIDSSKNVEHAWGDEEKLLPKTTVLLALLIRARNEYYLGLGPDSPYEAKEGYRDFLDSFANGGTYSDNLHEYKTQLAIALREEESESEQVEDE